MRPTSLLSIAIISLASMISSRAHANAWVTTTHVGYAVSTQSSTGFQGAGGTTAFLDLARPVNDDFEVGVRTVAAGARHKGGRAFYRMGAGPLVTWHFLEGWAAQLSAQSFSETAEMDDVAEYHSRGRMLLLGWVREKELSKRLTLSYGGFAARHEGSEGNSGTTRGIDLGLRLSL